MIDEKKLIEDVKEYYSTLKPQYISKLVEAVVEDIIDIIDEQPKLSLENKTSDKWIPCSKEQPPKPEDVTRQEYIVQAKGVIEPYIASWDGEKWFYDEFGGYEVEEGNILAWMPLPEPYKGEEK